MYRIPSNETAFIAEVPAIIKNKNIVSRQGKTPISLLYDELCEELAFPYILPNGKLDYNVTHDVPTSQVLYVNQRFLN